MAAAPTTVTTAPTTIPLGRGSAPNTSTGTESSATVVSPATTSPATATAPPVTQPAIPAAVFGVTADDVSDPSALAAELAALPFRPTVRVYFDVHQPASAYLAALQAIHPVANVMGELLDSSDEESISVSAFGARAASYVSALGQWVDVWEIGNEVNGNWTGPPDQVEAKLTEAYDAVAAAGGRSALTLYENDFGPDHCGDGPGELTPAQFSETYVPPSVRAGIDMVLLSYYPTQCGGAEPTSAVVAAAFARLHPLYPHAVAGFGEVGLPQPATAATAAQAEQIMSWAYSLDPGLDYYIGGYFWWYGAEDSLPPGAPLAGALRAAFLDEHQALSDRSPSPGSGK